MEDIEIEYLDEYKDLVLPGIKTSPEGRANQALDRMPQERRISSDSSDSSSIDPDIFQKLFDGKILDDELLTEKGSNPKSRNRYRLSSSSSDSNDALDALYNRKRTQYNRRNRLESYDSIDDLGDALMGPTLKTKAVPTTASKNVVTDGSRKGIRNTQPTKKCNTSPVFKPKSTAESTRPGTRANGRGSSSSSSNISILHNKKKAITIIKATKPDLKPPKHEPKKDPLNLQEFSDDTETDSSLECESDFYEDTDEDTPEMSKSIIDLSTDSSLVTSLAETVTPVVSEDESLNQQRNQCTSVVRERLQMFLNSLSSAESPPSSYKYTNREKKSLSREKQSISSDQKDEHPPENFVDHSLANADINFGTPSSSETQQSDVEKSRANYVDPNLTYEHVERLSRSLAKEITKIDEERTKEFEKRSASKTRFSTSSNKGQTVVQTSPITKRHVRKLTYSNEHLNEATPLKSENQHGNTDTVIPKRGRGRPSKKSIATANLQIVSKLPIQPIKKKEEEPTAVNTKTEELYPIAKIKRKPGRPPKNRKNETCVSNVVSEKLSEYSNPNPSKFKSELVNADEKHDLNNSKNKTHPTNTENSNPNGSIELSNKTEVTTGISITETEAIIVHTEEHSTQAQAVAKENLRMDMKHAEKKDFQLIKQYSAKDKTENVATCGAEDEAINNSECAKLGRVCQHNEDYKENTKTGSDEHILPGVDGLNETPQAGLSIQTPETKMNKSLKITKSKSVTNQECIDKNMKDGKESSSSLGMLVRKRLLRSESGTATQLRNSPRLAGKLPLARSSPRPTKGTGSQKRKTSSKVQTSDTDSKTGSDFPSLEQAAPGTKGQLSVKDIKLRTVDKDNPDKSIKSEGKEKSSAESTPSVTKDDRIELSKSTLSSNKTVLKTDIEMDSKGDQGSASASVTQTEVKMTGTVRGKKALHSERGREKSNSTMVPPATPKKDPSTGKAVSGLRSLGKSSNMDEGPKPKRSKLVGPSQDQEAKPTEIKDSLSVEEQKSNPKKQTLLPNTKADGENVANKTPKKLLLHERQKTTLRVTKMNDDNKSPALKSNLLTLLSGDESTAVDNTVIITKTPIMSKSEPFKKVETPATPTCGINISVSYYSPSKNLVTLADTVKKMKLNLCTKNLDDPPDALKTPPIQKLKSSVPVESGQKVDAIGKLISQLDKAPRQRVAERATLVDEVMQTVSKNESESLKAKESVSERIEQSGSEYTEAVNTTQNPLGTKLNEVLEAQTEAQKDAISAANISSPSKSSDSCNERKKRIARTPKLSHPAPSTVTHVNNLGCSLAPSPTPVDNPNLEDQLTKSINDVKADVPGQGLPQESQATQQLSVKCPKEQLVASDPSIAFPVRIIAATIETVPENVKSMAEPIATNQSQAPPVIVRSRPTNTNEPKLKAHPLLNKERKLRVRLKRCGIKNWLDGLNRTAVQPVSRIIQTDGIPTTTQAEADANNTQEGAPAMSVPLPVPLPPLEVKTEQMESLQQRCMGLDVPVTPVPQTVVDTSTTNRNNATSSTNTTIIPSCTSTCSTTSTPSASIANDQNTFGATKMFSFLYPSRYRSSYGNVGLDCCCPNLDGPMQAIDPTRLHSKAEVPVLELPECVVITTKIISKHDKNIPPKVKAKLEQLTSKNNLPCAIQSISMPSKDSATAATPIVDTSTSVSTFASRSDNSLNDTAEQSVRLSTAGTSVLTTCGIGNQHEDLKARVQCFDDLFQSLARQAASISMTERKRVINNIVKTTSLQPAEVEIGMKLLKDYAFHVNAVMQSQLQLRPRVFPQLTSPTTGTKTKTGMNLGTNSTVSPNLRQSLDTQAIFDKGNYQYLTKQDQGPVASGTESAVPVVSQHSQISKDTNTISSNITGTRYINPSLEDDKRVRMGAQNLLNASPVQKTPVNKVLSPENSMPLLETNPPAFGAAGKEDGSNHNLFIVNQVMSPPEECILPDAIGTLDVATEIKGEVDDAELLT